MKALRVCRSAVSLMMLAVWMTGCVCPANRQAGIPTITCQPVDTEVVAGGTAFFEAKVAEKVVHYEWARLKLTNKGLIEESLKDKPGGKSSRLRMENVTEDDQTYYFCTIVHKALGELGEVYSRTRNAFLDVKQQRFFALSITPTGQVFVAQVSTKMLATVTGGSTQLCDPGGDYTTSLTYNSDDAGKGFIPPPGVVVCELKVTYPDASGNEVALDNTKFGAQWATGGGYNDCANYEVGAKSRAFDILPAAAAKKHVFTIYFIDPQTAGTTYKLYVSWYKP